VFDTPTIPNFANWTITGALANHAAAGRLRDGLSGVVRCKDMRKQDER